MSRGAGSLGMHFSGWSGRYASIGRLARGPAPGRGPSWGGRRSGCASDSIGAADLSAGTGEAGVGVVVAPLRLAAGGIVPGRLLALACACASGGALASGSGVRCSFSGGGAKGA